MAEPTFAYVIWTNSRQKSIIKCNTITEGEAAPNQQVKAKWKRKVYAAKVIEVGKANFFANRDSNNYNLRKEMTR